MKKKKSRRKAKEKEGEEEKKRNNNNNVQQEQRGGDRRDGEGQAERKRKKTIKGTCLWPGMNLTIFHWQNVISEGTSFLSVDPQLLHIQHLEEGMAFFFFFPACTSHHVGSYFPDQGLNQNLPQWRCKVLNWTSREAPEEGMALAESNCQQKGKVAGARKDFEIHTLRNSLCCILTDVICLNTFYQQELTTSEAAHFLYRLWHSLENSLMRPQSIIHGFIVLGCPLGIT